MRNVRRIVTGHNEQNRSTVLFDGPPPRGAGMAAELWATDQVPAKNSGSDEATERPMRLGPPPQGSLFRYFEVHPESAMAAMDEVTRRTVVSNMFAAIGAADALVDTTRHAMMHKTHTVDYVVVLSGHVTLLLDDGEVDLEPLDAVVQRGTNHAWINRGTQPALLAVCMLPAEPETPVSK